jgi:hypothetical protein
MLPYFALIAIPSISALAGVRRRGAILLIVFLLYWLFVGFRFRVGTDWNNYLYQYLVAKSQTATELVLEREPGSKLLMWLGHQIGGGLITVNAVSALIFCWGLFAVARRCVEPYLALVVATPMLVVAFAMSATRQSLAIGIIFILFATWEKRTIVGRMALVFLATLFHFSSLFVLIFVALAAKLPLSVRLVAAALLGVIIGVALYFTPEAAITYSDIYLSGSRKLSAPGAWVQVGALAAAALIYFVYRKPWVAANGENALYRNLAIASLFAVPMIYISSVGAYRFALFFWPMGMYVWSGVPAMTERSEARLLYRVIVISIFSCLLWGWFMFANNSAGWLPYRNWLLQPEGASFRR